MKLLLLTIGILLVPNTVFAAPTSTRMLERIANRVPHCGKYLKKIYYEKHIYYTDGNGRRMRQAIGEAKPGIIVIAEFAKKKDLPYLVAHECAHIIDFEHNFSKRGIWGKFPYISEYAKSNAAEDFAEHFAMTFLNRKVPKGKKTDAIRAILDR